MLRQLAHAALELMRAHTVLAYERAETLRLDDYERGFSDGVDASAVCDDITLEDD